MNSGFLETLLASDLSAFINEEISVMKSELNQVNHSDDLDCVLKINDYAGQAKEASEALKDALLTRIMVKQQTTKEFLDFVVKEIECKIYLTTRKMDRFVDCIRQQTKMQNVMQAMCIQNRMEALQKYFFNCLDALQKRVVSIQENAKQLQEIALQKLDTYVDVLTKNYTSRFKTQKLHDTLQTDTTRTLQKFVTNQISEVDKYIHFIWKIKNDAVDYLEKIKDLMHKSTDPCKRSQKNQT